jgi:TorA maturation chaperone TorD
MLPKLENQENQALLNQEIAGGYFLFASLFYQPPRQDFLKMIIEAQLLTQARNIHHQGIEPLAKSIEDPRWLHQEEKIAVEFASLFVVPGQGMITPYESYYCDTLIIDHSTACSPYFQSQEGSVGLKGFLGGNSNQSVQALYKKFGFEINPAFFDLPDHVSAELEFIGKLYESGYYAEAENFHQKHLGRWVGLFLNKLSGQAKSSFYRAVAESLQGFLSMYDGRRDGKCLD